MEKEHNQGHWNPQCYNLNNKFVLGKKFLHEMKIKANYEILKLIINKFYNKIWQILWNIQLIKAKIPLYQKQKKPLISILLDQMDKLF